MFLHCLALFFLLVSLAVPASAWIVPSNTQLRPSTRLHFSNVVLRPSEDPKAFDSGKIGSPRVHRYIRDNDSSVAEYVMWYHGRSQEFPDDPNLPPLSTGRIGMLRAKTKGSHCQALVVISANASTSFHAGRAISKNGLVWEKCLEGSVSEDVSDVSLGLNQESWWGFDTTHIGLGQVMLPMSTPAVMSEGGMSRV